MTPTLPEALALRIELAASRVETIEAQIVMLQQRGQGLVAERNQLVAQARARLKASATSLYNTDTRQFEEPTS